MSLSVGLKPRNARSAFLYTIDWAIGGGEYNNLTSNIIIHVFKKQYFIISTVVLFSSCAEPHWSAKSIRYTNIKLLANSTLTKKNVLKNFLSSIQHKSTIYIIICIIQIRHVTLSFKRHTASSDLCQTPSQCNLVQMKKDYSLRPRDDWFDFV